MSTIPLERICEFPGACGETPSGKYAHFCDRHAAARRKKPAKWVSNPTIDAKLNEIYQAPDKRTQVTVTQYAAKVGWPKWALLQRAQKLGLSRKRREDYYWTEAEEQLLESHGWKSSKVISRILHRAGFPRTETSVALKQKRMGMLKRDITDIYTSRGLSGMFGCDSHIVTRWINTGLLKAKRRGTDRTDTQGGDMWMIRHADVREFVISNPTEFDIRKVDQVWFVDLLANTKGLN